MINGVEFLEQEDLPVRIEKFRKPPFFVWMLLRYKITHNELQATGVLFAIAAVVVAVSIYVYVRGTAPKQFDHPEFPVGYMNDPNYQAKYGNFNHI